MQTTDFVATVFDGTSNPSKVTVAFTMANAALQKHSATLILMAEGVYLAKPGGAQGMDIGKPFSPVPELLEGFLAGGGRLMVCRSCMEHNGLTEADLDPRAGIVTAPQVIELLIAAKGSLQIT